MASQLAEKEIEDPDKDDTQEFKMAYKNPDKAAKYMKEINRLTEKFMGDITRFDRHAEESAYEWYVHNVCHGTQEARPRIFQEC